MEKLFNYMVYNDGRPGSYDEEINIEDMVYNICRFDYWKGNQDEVKETLESLELRKRTRFTIFSGSAYIYVTRIK